MSCPSACALQATPRDECLHPMEGLTARQSALAEMHPEVIFCNGCERPGEHVRMCADETPVNARGICVVTEAQPDLLAAALNANPQMLEQCEAIYFQPFRSEGAV